MMRSISCRMPCGILALSIVFSANGVFAQDAEAPSTLPERQPLVVPAARPDTLPPPTEDPATLPPVEVPVERAPSAPVGPIGDEEGGSMPREADVEHDVALPAPGETVGEGEAEIRVTVRGQQGDRYDAPLAGRQVELSIIQPPHEIVARLVAVTGDDGIASFRAEPQDGLQAFARLIEDGREQFAPNGVTLRDARTYAMQIQDMPTVSDSGVVFATRIITIVELWENYTVFTQIYRLATDQPVIYQAETGDRTAGFKIPLPENATGIRVVQPQDQSLAEVVGKTVRYRGEIQPAGQAGEAPTMIVRYSIEDDNAASVAWTQDFPFDVEDLSLVVPQTSQHEKHPHLNVDITVPLCSEKADDNVMCFDSIDTNAEGVQMLQGTAVRIAHGGTVRAGGRMEVKTSGWPADPHVQRWAAVAALCGGLLLALLLWMRGRHRRDDRDNTRARLERERALILERVAVLERQLADAAILEIEYEAEREQIIGELALIERRLRQLEASASHG